LFALKRREELELGAERGLRGVDERLRTIEERVVRRI